MITLFTGCNSLLCTLTPDYTEEEAQAKLQDLLQEFNSIFDPSDKTPINAPEIDIPLKQEFKNNFFSDQNLFVLRGIKKLLIVMQLNSLQMVELFSTLLRNIILAKL